MKLQAMVCDECHELLGSHDMDTGSIIEAGNWYCPDCRRKQIRKLEGLS